VKEHVVQFKWFNSRIQNPVLKTKICSGTGEARPNLGRFNEAFLHLMQTSELGAVCQGCQMTYFETKIAFLSKF
jgi:hypothetical protein